LAANGHRVLALRIPAIDWAAELSVAALGAYAAEAARAWQRPPFRNREVPMDARHIKIADWVRGPRGLRCSDGAAFNLKPVFLRISARIARLPQVTGRRQSIRGLFPTARRR
jgi:hypothetical protein